MNARTTANRRANPLTSTGTHALGLVVVAATAIVFSQAMRATPRAVFAPEHATPAEIVTVHEDVALIAPGQPF